MSWDNISLVPLISGHKGYKGYKVPGLLVLGMVVPGPHTLRMSNPTPWISSPVRTLGIVVPFWTYETPLVLIHVRCAILLKCLSLSVININIKVKCLEFDWF